MISVTNSIDTCGRFREVKWTKGNHFQIFLPGDIHYRVEQLKKGQTCKSILLKNLHIQLE